MLVEGFNGSSGGGGNLPPAIYTSNCRKPTSGTSYTLFTADYSAKYSVYLIALNSEASQKALTISASINGTSISPTVEFTNSYSGSGDNRRNYRISKFDVSMRVGDVLSASVTDVSSPTQLMAYIGFASDFNTLSIAKTSVDTTTTYSGTVSGLMLCGGLDGANNKYFLSSSVYNNESVSLTAANLSGQYGTSFIFNLT